jgi:hypothetical protein
MILFSLCLEAGFSCVYCYSISHDNTCASFFTMRMIKEQIPTYILFRCRKIDLNKNVTKVRKKMNKIEAILCDSVRIFLLWTLIFMQIWQMRCCSVPKKHNESKSQTEIKEFMDLVSHCCFVQHFMKIYFGMNFSYVSLSSVLFLIPQTNILMKYCYCMQVICGNAEICFVPLKHTGW